MNIDGKIGRFAWLALVLLALLAIYLPGLGNPLIFDDNALTDGRIFGVYGSLLQGQPRALSYGSFVWVQAVFGEGWPVQRAFNLLIHIGVTLALWAFYREILKSIAPSDDEPSGVAYHQSPALGLAVGFFALNPVAVYAVAYLIQRSILMATLFVVLGLWLFARGLQRGSGLSFLAALACYVLAAMSKEHAIMAPLAALPVYIVVARPSLRRLALIGGTGAVLVGVAAAVLALRYGEIIGKPFDAFSKIYLAQLSALGPDVERNAYPLSILNQAWFFFKYGLHWLVPYAGWMSIDMRPPFPVSLTMFPQVLGVVGYLAVLAGGFFLIIRYRDWRALLGISVLLPALLFVTEFATVWVQDPFVLYRGYLWAIGAPGLVFFLFHGVSGRMLWPIGLVLAALFVWQASDRVHSLSSPVRVWSDAIAKLPDAPRAVGRWFPYLNRGDAYLDQGRWKEAFEDFRVSSTMGDKGMGMFNMGSLLFEAGRFQEALQAYDQSQQLGYDFPGLRYQRGAALHALGRLAEAHREFELALTESPVLPRRETVLALKGRVAMEMGQVENAIADLEAALKLDPRHQKARADLGMALVIQHDYARAHALFSQLIEESPDGPAYYGRALANHGLRNKAEALADIENAIRLTPDNPMLTEWRSRIRAMP
ncbi:MAG TPA: tetratricopeptide repeat protein [Thiobacillus sp.]|nr:tetratricopeptide repeat protein [Thiobacillus sp.]